MGTTGYGCYVWTKKAGVVGAGMRHTLTAVGVAGFDSVLAPDADSVDAVRVADAADAAHTHDTDTVPSSLEAAAAVGSSNAGDDPCAPRWSGSLLLLLMSTHEGVPDTATKEDIASSPCAPSLSAPSSPPPQAQAHPSPPTPDFHSG